MMTMTMITNGGEDDEDGGDGISDGDDIINSTKVTNTSQT